MSDAAIATAILPFLIALTVALECTRLGCTRLSRYFRENRERTEARYMARTHAH